MPRPKPEDGGWEDLNRRVTFYCPLDVLDAINAAMAATDRTKTQVIVDALRAELLEGVPPASARKHEN